MRVHFISTWLNTYPILCDALRLQTHTDWTMDLLHDGQQTVQHYGEWTDDKRIRIFDFPMKQGKWGHPLRDWALARIPSEPDWIVVSNHDNYIVPTFLEQMIDAAGGHDGAYCDCIHSHHGYKLLTARLECNHIDCGSLIVKADLARSTPWISRRFAADWDWIECLLKETQDFVHVPKLLFVHN